MLWSQLETRRQTQKTNIKLYVGGKPINSTHTTNMKEKKRKRP